MYENIITIKDLPHLQRNWRNWRARYGHDKKWHRRVLKACIGNTPNSPLKTAYLKCVRYSSMQPDDDNLMISFKPVVDGLIRAKIITDDNPSIIEKRNYIWKKTKQKEGFIQVYVKELK